MELTKSSAVCPSFSSFGKNAVGGDVGKKGFEAEERWKARATSIQVGNSHSTHPDPTSFPTVIAAKHHSSFTTPQLVKDFSGPLLDDDALPIHILDEPSSPFLPIEDSAKDAGSVV